MELAGVWRYPVKSLQGEALDSAYVEGDGLLGDRRWGIRDQRTGRILTARRRPELLAASAVYDGDMPLITLPDGRRTRGPGRDTDGMLSEWLESRVTLVASASSDPGRAEFFADATGDTSQAIEWIGRPLLVGAALLVPTEPCIRCTMVTRPQPGLDVDVDRVPHPGAASWRAVRGVDPGARPPGRSQSVTLPP